MKKILSLILCISLVLVPSISCFAEETGEIKSRIIETRINPLYEDVIDIENIEKISERVFGNDSKVAASVSSEEYSDTIEEAGDSLRQQMEERKTTAIVYYVNDYGYNEQIFKDIFNDLCRSGITTYWIFCNLIVWILS